MTVRSPRRAGRYGAALAVVGMLVALIAGGGRQVAGVLLGLAIVAAFFGLSSWAVARAGRTDDRLTLPAALGAYLVKLSLLGVVLVALPKDGWVDVRWMAVAVVAGTVLWSAMQVRHVLTSRQLYVDYVPPARDEDAQ